MDHEPSWDAVVAAAVETGIVADDAELAARLERYLDQPAGQLVEAISRRRLLARRRSPAGDSSSDTLLP